MKMNAALAAECRRVIRDYSGVNITEVQFAELMDAFPNLEKQLIRFESPSDTMDREDMLDALAVKITGRHWPLYRDGEEVAKQFHLDFERMAKEKGYELDPD